MQKETVLCTGASGMVVSRCIELLHPVYNFVGIGSKDIPNFPGSEYLQQYHQCNLINPDIHLLESIFDKAQPKFVLHGAGFVNVNQAETEKGNREGDIWKLHVEATGLIAKLTAKYSAHLTYTSTGYVFDGSRGDYSEDDVPVSGSDKLSYYGETKLQGEYQVLDSNTRSSILRFVLAYRPFFPGKLDFARRVIAEGRLDRPSKLYQNQTSSPIMVDDIVRAINKVWQRSYEGILHLGSPDEISIYQFGVALANKFFGDNRLILPDIFNPLTQPVPRPQYGNLISNKTSDAGITIPTNEQSIEEFYRQFQLTEN